MIARLFKSPSAWLLIFFAYFVGIWNLSVPLTGDQKVYLSVALEMKERSSFIIPYLFNKANFLKPPFQYWMTLLGWQIFGLSLLGAILPSVLAIIASAYWVRRISGSASYLPAFLFSSTLGTLTYGTTAQMEIWIVLFYLWAWGWFLEQKLFAALLVVGVMSWIKGPLYPVLWVASIFLYQILKKDWVWFRKSSTWFALVTGAFIGLLWYGLAALTHQQEMLDVFLGRENFGKIQTHQGNPFALWAEFFFSLFPLGLMIIGGLFSFGLKTRFIERRNFYIAFGLLPAVFFTFFPYRVNSYLYLLTPLVIWLCLPESLELSRPLRKVIGILSAVIAVLLFSLTVRLVGGAWIGWELGLPLALVLVLWSLSHFKVYLPGIAITSLLMVNLIRLGAVEIGEWDLAPLRHFAATRPQLAYFIDESHQDIWHEFGIISAALGTDIRRLGNETDLASFVRQGGSLILSDEQIIPSGLHCEDWTRIKRRIKFPLRDLLDSGLSIEDPALHRVYRLCYQSTD